MWQTSPHTYGLFEDCLIVSILFFFVGYHPTFFTMKINHGGFFSKFPGRRYLNGKVSYVDLLDGDEL